LKILSAWYYICRKNLILFMQVTNKTLRNMGF
jgi:hypothetical protein